MMQQKYITKNNMEERIRRERDVVSVFTFMSSFSNVNNIGNVWCQFGKEWNGNGCTHPATDVKHKHWVLGTNTHIKHTIYRTVYIWVCVHVSVCVCVCVPVHMPVPCLSLPSHEDKTGSAPVHLLLISKHIHFSVLHLPKPHSCNLSMNCIYNNCTIVILHSFYEGWKLYYWLVVCLTSAILANSVQSSLL